MIVVSLLPPVMLITCWDDGGSLVRAAFRICINFSMARVAISSKGVINNASQAGRNIPHLHRTCRYSWQIAGCRARSSCKFLLFESDRSAQLGRRNTRAPSRPVAKINLVFENYGAKKSRLKDVVAVIGKELPFCVRRFTLQFIRQIELL